MEAATQAVADINKHFGREVLVMSSVEYGEDVGKQADHIDMVIAGKYDYYVAPAMTQEGTVAPLEKLNKAGIPCFLYDRDTAVAAKKYRVCCFITNNVVAGQLEAQAIVDALKASGKPKPWKFSCVWGLAGASSLEDRKTGCLNVLNPLISSGDVKIVYEGYQTPPINRGAIRDLMDSVFSGNKDLAGAFFGWDDALMGGVEAAKAAGLKPGVDVFMGGIDAIDEARAAVKNGEVTVTVAQGNYAMAYWAILGGFAYVTMGWRPPSDVIEVPLTPVTKANVDTFTLLDPKLSAWKQLGGPAVEDLKLP
jgi:ribose transport system substrate-binding protein/inositol transport system substrate-binding protein